MKSAEPTAVWRRTVLWLRALLLAAALLPAAHAAPAANNGAVLVTDLTGAVSREGEALTILSLIPPDSEVRLAAGATLTTLVLGSTDEYRFAGPARIRFHDRLPLVLEGAPPQRRDAGGGAGDGKGLRLNPNGLTQATYVMRGSHRTTPIVMRSPLGSRVLGPTPEFAWQPVAAHAQYALRIVDDAGNLVYEHEGEALAVTLPESAALREGVAYLWNVSAASDDGSVHVAGGPLALASAELRRRSDELRPGAGAPVSDRVGYGLWLSEVGLGDEARVLWRALALERPADPQLKALAGD